MLRKCLIALLGMMLLAGLACAQSASTPVPPGPGPHYPLPRVQVSAKIVSRVKPADQKLLNQEWLLAVRQKLLMSLRPLIPDTARPPMGQPGTVVLVVRLGRKGVPRDVRVLQSSADPALVKAAEGAAKSANPYPPFPFRAKARHVKLQVTLQFN